jgi:hypothetical protein
LDKKITKPLLCAVDVLYLFEKRSLYTPGFFPIIYKDQGVVIGGIKKRSRRPAPTKLVKNWDAEEDLQSIAEIR